MNKSVLEKVAGSTATTASMSALAAFIGTPLSALLPVLTNSLANGRYQKRIEKVLGEINDALSIHKEKIEQLSDEQFKLMNELLLTILQTTEERKIAYLKSAVISSLDRPAFTHNDAQQISRIVRDMSAEEIIFLIQNKVFNFFSFGEKSTLENELTVPYDTQEGVLLSGLISLGLIVPCDPTWDGTGRYRLSPLAQKVVELIDV